MFRRRREGATWALGDWLVRGEVLGMDPGFRQSRAITGYSRSYLYALHATAIAWPIADRVDALSWAVHKHLCMEPDSARRRALLQVALAHRWTDRDAMAHFRQRNEQPAMTARAYENRQVMCPCGCGHIFAIKGNKVPRVGPHGASARGGNEGGMIRSAVLLAWLVCAGVAQAQPVTSPSTVAPVTVAATYAPNRLDVVQAVDRACPGLVLRDHAFTDAVVLELRRRFPNENWGRNGKRGNANDPSHDAAFMPTTASPFGGAVIDIIAAAGSPGARPAWIDQTDATVAAGTIGVWVAPSGLLPDCLTGGSTAPGPGPGQPAPPAQTDLTDILVTLSRIEDRLMRVESAMRHDDLSLLTAYVEDMVGDGPEGGTGPHVTDIKQRLDVVRVQLEQLTAWLRSRTILRR